MQTLYGALVLAATLAAGAGAAAEERRVHDTDLRESPPAGTTLEIDDVVGSIVATQAEGDRATIHARVTSRGSIDPADVTISTVRTAGRIRICAVLPGEDASACSDNAGRRSHHGARRSDDVAVDLTVTVPARVRLVANAVSGNVRAVGLRGDVTVATVQGNVTLATSGRAEASAVDGSLDVRLGRDADGMQRFHTINGAIRVTLPRDANATVRAATLSGDIRGERGFAFAAHDGGFVGRSASATLGTGGSHVSLDTISGDIAVGFD